MHADELDLDEALVRGLLAEQFPEWAGLSVHRIEPSGTVNAIFRLGDDLSVRLARRDGPTEPGGKELDWLPRLAPQLPLEIPVPVAQGRPSVAYPWFWDVYSWVEGETVPLAEIDAMQAARDLAAFVASLQKVDPSGAPQGRGIPLADRNEAMPFGSSGSPATPPPSSSGSGRLPLLRGKARRYGTTATSTSATGSCATGGSAA